MYRALNRHILAVFGVEQYAVACKRACVADGYYEAFNRPNVQLVALPLGDVEPGSMSGVRIDKIDALWIPL